MNKFFVLAFVILAIAHAEDEKKDAADGPKTFKRLIPADVLRGEWHFFYLMQRDTVQGFEKLIICVHNKVTMQLLV